ncbi:hypothetical protein LF1_26400 [Rubripirellula obstinata]|uniref:Uncharacterized protein n=1 Tax=Rubripirellula obstinata TaxID=406547 RepID=A0A5B1CIK4_9BACT|nr:hypothetical protein [Rubripirellula obstinata]KAA1260101.1 hypothetical protein LF1_26400 [Rubripirellula obstinata]
MNFLESKRDAQSSIPGGASHARYQTVLLCIAAGIVVMAGCRSACQGNRQCHSRSVPSTCHHVCASPVQPQVQQAVESPLYQLDEVTPVDQNLMGGYGLAPVESYPTESPVQVEPVPMQYSQPVESDAGRPAVEPELDAMQLDDSQIADPMEI